MELNRLFFTSESVTEGHPDKVADAISDAVLDLYLSKDSNARVACETMVTSNFCLLAGEVRANAEITNEEIENVVRETIKNIGYTDPADEFSYDTVEIVNKLHMQSTDIAMGVDNSLENKASSAEEFVEGAGDQGMMFGYACNETEELMPYAISLAHKLTKRLSDLRTSGRIKWLKPDGKSQVTVEYDEDGIVKRIEAIVVSTMHTDDIEIDELRRVIRGEVIDKVIDNNLIDENTKIYINPTGRFVIGGPHGDSGLTGRKIIVDTYGGKAPHGGGAFCVDGNTEFITPEGWKKISEYTDGDLVGQWNDGRLEFIKPFAYINQPADKMYNFKSRTVDMVLSENHDVVMITSKGNLIKKRVKDLLDSEHQIKNGNHGEVPTYFKYEFEENEGIKLTNDEIRLQVAFCADGTIVNKGTCRVRLKKQYKIDRLIELLDKTNTFYTITDDGDFKIFRFEPPMKLKSLKDCFCRCNYKQIKIIAEEIFNWDGDTSKIFRTTIKDDADFVQFILMATTARNVSIREDNRIGESYKNNEYIRKSICYELRLKDNSGFSIKNHLILVQITSL